jgi:hypothetical protein
MIGILWLGCGVSWLENEINKKAILPFQFS